MPLAVDRKKSLIEKFRVHEGDTGSPEVQIALLTERINGLTDHFKQHIKETPSGVVILDVLLEVIRETVDALREERDLHFGRPRVALVDAEQLDQALLLFDGERHRNFLQSPRSGKSRFTRTGSEKCFYCQQIRSIPRGRAEVK